SWLSEGVPTDLGRVTGRGACHRGLLGGSLHHRAQRLEGARLLLARCHRVRGVLRGVLPGRPDDAEELTSSRYSFSLRNGEYCPSASISRSTAGRSCLRKLSTARRKPGSPIQCAE